MTRLFRVNENNDIYTLPGGRIVMATDLDAVSQQAEHAIKAQIGEMVYDAGRGTNIETTLFVGAPNVSSFEASAREALNRIPDITEVVDFRANIIDNSLVYQATLRTVFGTVQVSSDGLL